MWETRVYALVSEWLWGAHKRTILQAMKVGPKMQLRVLTGRDDKNLNCLPEKATCSGQSLLKIEYSVQLVELQGLEFPSPWDLTSSYYVW